MDYEFGASKGFVSVKVTNEDGVRVVQLPIKGSDLDSLESAVNVARQYENND